jgi:hypothetical protein
MRALQLGTLTEVGGTTRVAGWARRQLGGEGGGSGRHDADIHGNYNATTARQVQKCQFRGPLQPESCGVVFKAPRLNEAIAQGEVWSDVGAGADGAARRERSPAPVHQKVSSPYRCTALALPRTSWLALN